MHSEVKAGPGSQEPSLLGEHLHDWACAQPNSPLSLHCGCSGSLSLFRTQESPLPSSPLVREATRMYGHLRALTSYFTGACIGTSSRLRDREIPEEPQLSFWPSSSKEAQESLPVSQKSGAGSACWPLDSKEGCRMCLIQKDGAVWGAAIQTPVTGQAHRSFIFHTWPLGSSLGSQSSFTCCHKQASSPSSLDLSVSFRIKEQGHRVSYLLPGWLEV